MSHSVSLDVKMLGKYLDVKMFQVKR